MDANDILDYLNHRKEYLERTIDAKFQYNLEHGCMIPCKEELARLSEIKDAIEHCQLRE